MPVLRRGRSVQWVDLRGRKVKLKSLGGVQSVNVCTSANVAGNYEEVQYLTDRFKMTADDVARYADLDSFKKDLRRRAYQQAK